MTLHDLAEYRKDEYKKVQIPFGFNNRQEKILLSLFHTFFVAMTGHGKTLGMKSLLHRFLDQYPDWRVLIIDSKDKRDYADLNADVPICFVETTEPLDLKNLLEPVVGAKMMYYFDKIIEEAVFDTLGEVQRSIAQKVEDADAHKVRMSGKDLGKLRVLNYTMKKLVALVEKPNIVRELKLHDGFNVMAIGLPDVKNPTLKRAFQQLIVRSALILLLSDPNLERTLLILDESHKWSSQRYGSICKQPLSEFVSEGRSQDKFVWLSDQALTKVDKEPLKNIKIWVVGQQMEANEVEDARNAVNDITDLNITDNDIKTLKLGNFILVDGLHGRVERAYLQPFNVPDELAIQIAGGADPELAEPLIREFESQSLEDDEVYRAKFEEEKRKREECEKEFARQLEHLSNRMAEEKIRKTLQNHVSKDELQKAVAEADLNGYSRGRAEAETEEHPLPKEVVRKVAAFDALNKALIEFAPTPVPTSVDTPVHTTLGLQPIVTVVELEEIKRELPKVPSDTVKGKVLRLVKEEFFKTWKALNEVQSRLDELALGPNTSQTVTGALAELVEADVLGMKHTDRNRWKLAPNVIIS
jgi:hypothetical protein